MENNSQNPEPFGQPQSPSPPQPNAPITPQYAPEAAPKVRVGNYLLTAFGVLLLLVIFLPNSAFAQSLAYPIIILGFVAGVMFFVETVKSSSKMNVLARGFIIFAGVGVGIVIFFASLIAGVVVGFSKDPNPQGCG